MIAKSTTDQPDPETTEPSDLDDSGFRQTRIAIPPAVWQLFFQLASDMDTTPRWVLRWFFRKIDHMVKTGDLDVFGPEFLNAHQQLIDQIDLSKLHRSDDLASGFVGIYVTGGTNGKKRFRAVGRNPLLNEEMVIGFFPAAEEAAWARYLHYQKHKLPYGEYAIRLKRIADEHQDTLSVQQVRERAGQEIAKEEWENRRKPQKQVY
jgi:hypothetical protein